MLGACTLYSNTYGNAGVDGVLQVKFTVKEGFSQAMSNILINTCNWDYACFSTDTDTVVKDLIGQQAINDCGIEVCDGVPGGPTDAIDAFYNRAFTNPGGFPNKDWTQRCVAFEVHTGFPDFWNERDAYYIIGSWQWFRPGSWNCGP
jgi:hypothetical protein